MTTHDPFQLDIARHVWETRYRAPGETGVAASWRRVAHAIAAVEGDADAWAERFFGVLDGFRFLPGGRILAGAGTDKRVTLLNCFVMGALADDLEHIFDALKEGALTMQHGGGVGYDFSPLRPAGRMAHASGTIASDPVSFMRIWDAMCATPTRCVRRSRCPACSRRCGATAVGWSTAR